MRSEPGAPRPLRRRGAFWYGVAVVTLVLMVGAVVGSRWVAQAEALSEAEERTKRLAALVVAPLLSEALAGNGGRMAELDRAIDGRIGDRHLAEVIVWNREGRILYASDAEQNGRQLPVTDEVAAAIDAARTNSAFEGQPEPAQEATSRGAGYLEVYVPLLVAGQPPLAFEAYYDYAGVEDTAASLLWRLIPLVLIPLLVLQLIQLPIAFSLRRRVRAHQAERAELLAHSLSGSERERVRIAADLHDGPIQDLAGIAYALGAIAPSIPAPHKPLMSTVQVSVLHAVESLRRLMVDLYPPDLDAPRLPNVLASLAVPLRERGVDVTVTVDELPDLDKDTVTMLYRVTREALRNVEAHAEASSAAVTLTVARDPQRSARLLLGVYDNGRGVDVSQIDRRAEGHLGLRLLIDRADSLGGHLGLRRRAEGGTAVELALPIKQLASATTSGATTSRATPSVVDAAARP